MTAATSIAEIREYPFWAQFSEEQIRASIQRSKEGIEWMKAKALAIGKKQGGYTVAQLDEMIERYNRVLAS